MAAEEAERWREHPAQVDLSPKCWRCKRVMAEYLGRPWSLRCPRCKAENRREQRAA